MPNTVTSLIGRLTAAAALLLTLSHPALAQTPIADPPTSPQFLSNVNLSIVIAALSSSDQRFSWDTRCGGDFDLVDYVNGRVNLVAIYQAVLGSEFRPFDPNQGNYTLEASGSARVGKTEIAGMFHHLSQHLSDRPKRFAVAYNAIGGRVLREVAVNGTTVDVKADLMKVVQQSYVDYAWLTDLDITIRHRVAPHASLFAHGSGTLVGVDKTIAGRDMQRAGRGEVGVRLDGTRGDLDIFAGAERLYDADQITRETQHWAFVGFRVLSH